MSNKSSQKVQPTPPHTAAPPRSPTSPSRRSSPFRFTGHTQAHFSPSVLSLSPPPPNVSTPSPPGRLNFPHGASSPQRSLSSLSGCSEVLSLEELFPVGPASEDRHSEMSAVSSEGERTSSGCHKRQERQQIVFLSVYTRLTASEFSV